MYTNRMYAVKEYTKRLEKNSDACCTDFEDNWDGLMEDEIESIWKQVEKLKNQ